MPDHVFISYARKDGRDHAARLDADLTAVGFRTWRDTRDIDPNQDFSAELERAIAESSHVVCCITPDTRRDDSFVRREIGYALAVKKPVVPLVFENTVPPIQIVNVTRINANPTRWPQTVDELRARLQHTEDLTYEQVTLPVDPYRDYLTALYDQIVRYLNLTVFSLITLHSEASLDAVAKTTTNVLPMAFFDMAGIDAGTDHRVQFKNLQEAFDKYDGRVLLLGEPGAGKTTTLFAFARDAVAARLANPKLPIPILAPIVTWNAKAKLSLVDWMANTISALNRDDIARLIASGNALLILDGLDELGREREDEETQEHYDPRLRFIAHIVDTLSSPASNQIIVSCRLKDYEDIGQKITLNGSVTLLPLNDQQMRDYLRDLPDLWAALEADNDLREVARTPLLLSLFTFAFRDLPHEAQLLRDLKGGDVRDKIFETYVRRRYERESNKPYADLAFTLEEIYSRLGYVAMENARVLGSHENILGVEEFASAMPEEMTDSFISLAIRLNLITADEKNTLRFTHLLIRDYFAFQYAFPRLSDSGSNSVRVRAAYAVGAMGDSRAVEPLIDLLHSSSNEYVRRSAVYALVMIGDLRAVEPLLYSLLDKDKYVRSNAAYALGKLRDVRAIENLLSTAINDEAAVVRGNAVEALTIIGTPEAIAAVEIWRKSQKGD